MRLNAQRYCSPSSNRRQEATTSLVNRNGFTHFAKTEAGVVFMDSAGDWLWIVDHTVQIGELKCMVVVGFRLGVWRQQENRTLTYEDVELIGLWPVRTSTGEIVNDQLESGIGRTSLPQLIISLFAKNPLTRIAQHQGFGELHWVTRFVADVPCSQFAILRLGWKQ